MPDTVNTYAIEVTDKVAPSISTKLDGIGQSALRAGVGVNDLQQNINKLNASGITATASAIRQANNVSQTLSRSAGAYARSAATASANTTQFTASLNRLIPAAASAVAQLNALSTNTGAVARAMNATSNAGNQVANVNNAVGNSATGAAGGVRNVNAALGLFRGNITSANRLAGSFVSTLIGTGPAVAAAFSVLGVVAFVSVLYQISQAIVNVVEQVRGMDAAMRNLGITEAKLNAQGYEFVQDQIGVGETLARIWHNLSDNSQFNPANGGKGSNQVNPFYNASELVQTTSGLQKEFQLQNAIAQAQARNNEAGLKGAALDRQKGVEADAAAARIQTQIQKVNQLEASFEKLARDPNQSTAQVEFYNKQITSATELARELKNTKQVDIINADTERKAAAVAQVRDTAKAAAAELRELDNRYKQYVGSLDHKITPPESLRWWEGAESGLKYYSENIDAVNAKEATFKQQIAARNDQFERGTETLNEQIAQIGEYSDALKISGQLNRQIQEFQKTGMPLTAQEIALRREQITTLVQSQQYMQALSSEYNTANGPQRTYMAQFAALQTLINTDPGNTAAYQRQLQQATRAYKDALDPMREYQRNLSNETALFGNYGTALKVATEYQAQQTRLQNLGYSSTQIDAMLSGLREQLTLLEQTRDVQADINEMYNSNAGAVEKLTNAQTAANEAYAKGIITASQYTTATRNNNVALNELYNNAGLGNWQSHVAEVMGQLTKDFTTFSNGATKAFTGFYKTLVDGGADAVGRWVAYGGSLTKALADVARQGVATLISSLIKLGIEWVITTALAKAFGINLPKQDSGDQTKQIAANAAASIAAITAITAAQYVAYDLLSGPAWSLAEAVSLASFGANAIPATTGIAAVQAAGTAAQKFAGGGPVNGPGTSTSDSIPAYLSAGEFVLTARDYARNKGAIDAIHNGATVNYGSYNAAPLTPASANSGLNVNVIHDGSTAVQVMPGLSENEVHVIAKSAVYQHSDDAVSQHVNNPSSRVSRSMQRATGVRKRG